MDTNRIIINNHDLSTVTRETPVGYSGFTVVKAPKGPRTPVYLAASAAARMQDIFGVSSSEYPELFEAELYNSQYALYLSAPYNTASVPAAYLTKKGIYLAANNIPYEEKLEYFALNGSLQNPEDTIDGVNDFTEPESQEVLVPADVSVYYTQGFTQGTGDSQTTQAGLLVKVTDQIGASLYPMLNEKTFRVAGLPFKRPASAPVSYINATINCNTGEILDQGGQAVIGQLLLVSDSSAEKPFKLVTNVDTTSGAVAGDTVTVDGVTPTTGVYFILTGAEASDYLKQLDVAKRLDEVNERNNLKFYMVSTLTNELGLSANEDIADSIYAVIFPKYPSTRTLHISFKNFDQRNYKANSVEARNTLYITAYEDSAFHSSSGLAVSFEGYLGQTNGTVPAFNATNSGYMDQELVAVYSDKKFKEKGDLDDSSLDLVTYGSFDLTDGIRDLGKDDNTLHNLGWAFLKEPEYADIDICFSSQRHYVSSADFGKSGVWYDSFTEAKLSADDFFTLVSTARRKTTGFMFNYTVDPEALQTKTTGNFNINSVQLDFGPQYWNVCNELVVDLVDGSRFMSPMTGSAALMQTRIIQYGYGGVAPEWTNSGTPSMGGQLPGLVSTKLRFKYDKDQQDLLDAMNFNPVISDRTYGLMRTGHKTCQSGDLTDWSYIGHACSFLAFEKEVRTLVMQPQLGKPNNPYYRELRKFQVEEILAKRLQGSGRIWAFGDVNTSTDPGVNDAQALKALQFRIKVRVKVDIYSEYVILDFYNLNQDADV